jgi:hypothetical protein
MKAADADPRISHRRRFSDDGNSSVVTACVGSGSSQTYSAGSHGKLRIVPTTIVSCVPCLHYSLNSCTCYY